MDNSRPGRRDPGFLYGRAGLKMIYATRKENIGMTFRDVLIIFQWSICTPRLADCGSVLGSNKAGEDIILPKALRMNGLHAKSRHRTKASLAPLSNSRQPSSSYSASAIFDDQAIKVIRRLSK